MGGYSTYQKVVNELTEENLLYFIMLLHSMEV